MTEQQTTTDGLQQTGTSTPAAPRRWRSALLVGLFVLISAGGYWFGASQIVAPTENPSLYVAAQHLNFGEVWMEDDFQWALPIVNPTTRDIVVHQLVTSCGCITIEPASFVVPAQGLTTVNLALDLRPTQPVERNDASRAFEVTIVAVTDQMVHKRLTWALRGQVRTPFHVAPAEIDFGDSLIHGSSYPSRSADVECMSPVKGLSVQCDPAMATVQVKPQTGRETAFELEIFPNPALPLGEHRFAIELEPKLERPHDQEPANEYHSAPALVLPVVARVKPQVQSTPASILLGTLGVDDVAEEIVVVSSRETPFHVHRVSHDEKAGLKVKRLDGEQPTMCKFRLTFSPTKAGSQHHDIRFTVKHVVDGETYEITVPVVCHVRESPTD